MTVLFDSGGLYEYYNLPAGLWEDFVAAQPHPWSQVGYPRSWSRVGSPTGESAEDQETQPGRVVSSPSGRRLTPEARVFEGCACDYDPISMAKATPIEVGMAFVVPSRRSGR
jgi:hypothetical protein